MTCETYEEQISAMIDHELKDEETGMLFAHLSACRSCRHSLQSVLDLRSDFSEQTPPMAPKELDERILKRTRLAQHASKDRRAIPFRLWAGRISMPVPVAAVILVFLIASSMMVSSMTKQKQMPPEGRVEAVYITTLPAVEVQGNFP
jgi:anti-sigma factor RsiW